MVGDCWRKYLGCSIRSGARSWRSPDAGAGSQNRASAAARGALAAVTRGRSRGDAAAPYAAQVRRARLRWRIGAHRLPGVAAAGLCRQLRDDQALCPARGRREAAERRRCGSKRPWRQSQIDWGKRRCTSATSRSRCTSSPEPGYSPAAFTSPRGETWASSWMPRRAFEYFGGHTRSTCTIGRAPSARQWEAAASSGTPRSRSSPILGLRARLCQAYRARRRGRSSRG